MIDHVNSVLPDAHSEGDCVVNAVALRANQHNSPPYFRCIPSAARNCCKQPRIVMATGNAGAACAS